MTPSIHRIQIPIDNSAPNPLPLMGTNPQGRTIQANSRYLSLDGKPWLPVMGEFHFSRYPNEQWTEELLKMKAGGITIVATYLFWIHIEEEEGVFNWSADHDLRRFIQLCDQCGLFAYPRIGPWAHGECRNGGFPDWLLEKCGREVRKDTSQYLEYVQRFYQQIAAQLEGLLWKDGGPVIGIQIENELLDNAGHIRTLKRMAQSVGLDVPLYTMTGWGPAQVPLDEAIIPVFGGYPDAFWDRQVEEWSRPSRKHYFFSSLRDDNTIGADLGKRSDVGDMSYLERYPYGTCETGGGMQVSYHRRPRIAPEDISAIALTKVGSGSNLQGYYMYHGGANPVGRHSTMQESQATDYPNDLPVINYDFQAPLGQYGQARESYHALRPLHLFLDDFGSLLAPVPSVFPENVPQNIDDRSTLRWAARSDGHQGFLFINNHQRMEPLAAHEAVQFEVALPDESLLLPAVPTRIPNGMQAVLPFNIALGTARLKYATAQLICTLQWHNRPLFVFSALDEILPEFVFERGNLQAVQANAAIMEQPDRLTVKNLTPGTDCVITIHTNAGEDISILLLAHDQARQLWKARVWGQEHLFLSEEMLYFENEGVYIQASISHPEVCLSILPDAGALSASDGTLAHKMDGFFTRWTISRSTREIQIQAQCTRQAGPSHPMQMGSAGVAAAPDDEAFAEAEVWHVSFPPDILDGLHEVLLRVDYLGDCARAYMNGRLIDDDFYHGRAWEIGIRRFAPEILEKGLDLKILPLRKDAPIYLPGKDEISFGDAEAVLRVNQITADGVTSTILHKS